MKRFLNIILSLCMVLVLFPMNTYAQETDYLEWNYEGRLQMSNADRPIDVYLNLDKLKAYNKDYKLEFVVGYGTPEDFYFYGNDFTEIRDENDQVIGVSLDCRTIANNTLETSAILIVELTTPNENGYYELIERDWLYIDYENTYKYNDFDKDLFIAYSDAVDNEIYTQDYSESVKVVGVIPSNDNVTVRKTEYYWDIIPNKVGKTDITIKHETLDGGIREYTYTLNIVDNIWSVDVEHVTTDKVLPGETTGFYANVINTYLEDGKIKTRKGDYVLKWEHYMEHEADVTEEGDHLIIDVYKDAYIGNELSAGCTVMTKQVVNGKETLVPVASDSDFISIVDKYYTIDMEGFDPYIKIGESTSFKPVMKRHTFDGEVHVEEITDATYDFEGSYFYTEVSEKNGIYTIKRLGYGYGLVSYTTNYDQEMDVWGHNLALHEYEYTVRYKNLKDPYFDTTWLTKDETFVLEYDTSHITDDMEGITYKWEIPNGDFYTMAEDGKSILIDGKKMNDLNLDSVYIIVRTYYNGKKSVGWGCTINLVDKSLLPQINTIEDGKTYYGDKTITLSNYNLFIVNGEIVKLDENNQYTLKPNDKPYTLYIQNEEGYYEEAKIYVKEPLSFTYGDTNGDNKLNQLDRMVLARYLAKWQGYTEIDVSASDVHKDGKVNQLDRMTLARHLAKWQGYETLPYVK